MLEIVVLMLFVILIDRVGRVVLRLDIRCVVCDVFRLKMCRFVIFNFVRLKVMVWLMLLVLISVIWFDGWLLCMCFMVVIKLE